MRNLEDIERDLAQAREALSSVEGTPAEVYSRIVGYYRSVRNWNRGKREEYGERRLYLINDDVQSAATPFPKTPVAVEAAATAGTRVLAEAAAECHRAASLLLFVRSSCPNCPPAKAAAERLGIPVSLVNADTEAGMAEAVRRNVFSTPTAILVSAEGEELRRARDAKGIGTLLDAGVSPGAPLRAEPVAV